MICQQSAYRQNDNSRVGHLGKSDNHIFVAKRNFTEAVAVGQAAQSRYRADVNAPVAGNKDIAHLIVGQRHGVGALEVLIELPRIEPVESAESTNPDLSGRVFGNVINELIRYIVALDRRCTGSTVRNLARTGRTQRET